MNAQSVKVVEALGDNYMYLVECCPGRAFVVDPADARTVSEKLDELGFELAAVLATHHHWDHTAGISELKKRFGCKVYSGDAKRIAGTDRQVGDGDIIRIDDTEVEVISTPGHTATSVCYYIGQSLAQNNFTEALLFTGDTLFVAGCGRLFEGSAEVMYESFQRLARLDARAIVYPGHDYTIEDYQFALSIEPENLLVRDMLEKAQKRIQETGISVPSNLEDELAGNPFLRTDSESIKTALKMPADADSAVVFAELRRRKDRF